MCHWWPVLWWVRHCFTVCNVIRIDLSPVARHMCPFLVVIARCNPTHHIYVQHRCSNLTPPPLTPCCLTNPGIHVQITFLYGTVVLAEKLPSSSMKLLMQCMGSGTSWISSKQTHLNLRNISQQRNLKGVIQGWWEHKIFKNHKELYWPSCWM